jgi:hypothetical protein
MTFPPATVLRSLVSTAPSSATAAMESPALGSAPDTGIGRDQTELPFAQPTIRTHPRNKSLLHRRCQLYCSGRWFLRRGCRRKPAGLFSGQSRPTHAYDYVESDRWGRAGLSPDCISGSPWVRPAAHRASPNPRAVHKLAYVIPREVVEGNGGDCNFVVHLCPS